MKQAVKNISEVVQRKEVILHEEEVILENGVIPEKKVTLEKEVIQGKEAIQGEVNQKKRKEKGVVYHKQKEQQNQQIPQQNINNDDFADLDQDIINKMIQQDEDSDEQNERKRQEIQDFITGLANKNKKNAEKMESFSEKNEQTDENDNNIYSNYDDGDIDMFRDDFFEKIDQKQEQNYFVAQNNDCDDPENYFKIRIGDILNQQYRILQKCGKGVFSNVCKAEQISTGKVAAIKILRREEIMTQSGEREKEVVQKLNQTDKNDKKHIVRLKNIFEHKKHLCLVFEYLAMNLREALKIYGKGKGFSLEAVRSYAFQIFIALSHLKKNNLIHADLKPDNLLISSDTKTLKMCDFGTALPMEETGLIKYIQSRYYRAPEVMLGYPPYSQIDVWSVGITLYEIYTAKFLFKGESNNEMIKLIMDCRVSKQKYILPIKFGDIPKNDINKLLLANKENVQQENQKKLTQFKDLLDKCLQLDPKNRITPEEALKHPFLEQFKPIK
ncbi:serine threonine protein kinase, putative [Ichthyophthirius multifiliis]|uniref:Serine threonine protein kinase, putative n=1 Tax=Ichthyophthirius multifiliis TaxID=5932 RepID=G0R5X8_ICHMU|nr:serine threonine protein kinase, putative [Ichthyophthirius multifiliis]EGR27102.1 serine threonine protein kinase, putative [Ichthyophthirius multifiliis]|eukprot:XP_004023986.1 serine threonine protein kinase, putative [Ichthyophthirius multifiliis]